ncbi:MAG TPA: glucosyl transferase [Ignavibacteriaceae bacterium]|nr:glucosyl transferase [Ignavibacteriaceae bacterium]
MKSLLEIVVLLTVIWINGCNTTEPPPPPETKPTLSLALEDVSCTEAWLQLTTKDLELPAELTLKQYNPTGDSLSQDFLLNTQDSLLYIDSLLPNQTYSFQVSSILNPASGNQYQVSPEGTSSNKVTATTLDTTSHNFTFTSWTFGTVGSSVLYDVAIINENNIWAVGEIMIADTSQNGYTIYNALHWDGGEWELLRIPNYDYPNALIYGALQTIFAFSENDVWFCSYSNLVHYDGNSFTSKAQFMTSINFTGQVTKMWGTDKNNIYCVGRNGAIYHYNGTNWQRIESGTSLNINDIWGDYNEKTQKWEVLAVASNIYSSFDKEVIKIKNTSPEILNKEGIDETLSSLWFITNKKYYLVGSGTYEKTNLCDPIWKGDPLDITNYFENRVRASDVNDAVIVGAYGEAIHFNGFTWKSFFSETSLSNGTYLSVGIHNDLITAVGYQSAQAVITVGAR